MTTRIVLQEDIDAEVKAVTALIEHALVRGIVITVDLEAAQGAQQGEPMAWQHASNEWADIAVNGLQWLKNIKDGASSVDDAIADMHSGIRHCRKVVAGITAPPHTMAAGDEGKAGPAYGIIDPDYARVYTQARIIAWQYGYACVIHGSFTRDLDLLLVPWDEKARENDEQLLKLIAQACGLRFRDGQDEMHKATVDFTEKPHGRKSCSLYFPAIGDRRWIDISVVPCPASSEQGEKK